MPKTQEDKPLDQHLQLRVNGGDLSLLRTAAALNGRTMSEIAREAIVDRALSELGFDGSRREEEI